MNRVLLIVILLAFSKLTFSQEKKRFNFKLGYSISSQNFKYNRFEFFQDKNLKKDMPEGSFYQVNNYKPTTIQTITLSSTIFKNKNYWFDVSYFWTNTVSTSSYGYSVNQQNFPLKREASLWYTFKGFSYGVSRKISLKKYGFIIPRISFSQVVKDEYRTSVSFETINNMNGDVIKKGELPSSGGGINFIGTGRTGVLMLFDAPRLGFDYEVNIYKGLSVKASYSYWAARGIPTNFYGLIGRRNAYWNDFYGSAFNVGISYALFKEKE